MLVQERAVRRQGSRWQKPPVARTQHQRYRADHAVTVPPHLRVAHARGRPRATGVEVDRCTAAGACPAAVKWIEERTSRAWALNASQWFDGPPATTTSVSSPVLNASTTPWSARSNCTSSSSLHRDRCTYAWSSPSEPSSAR